MKFFVRIISVLIGGIFCLEISYSQQCNIYYVSPNGNGNGSTSSPMGLSSAISSGANSVLRLASGTYTITNTLNIPSNITIEGGYDPSTWIKSNYTQTIIRRTNANPTPAPARIVALQALNSSNFKLLDLTITTDDAPGAGVSNYGIYLSGCNDYNITRCKITAGKGSNGINGGSGIDGANGVNGANGIAGQECGSVVGLGGLGGTSGAGGQGGNGGDGGQRGTSDAIQVQVWPPSISVTPGRGFDGQAGQAGAGACGGAGGTFGQRNGDPGNGLLFELPPPSCSWFGVVGFGTAGPVNHGQPGQDGCDGIDGADGINGVPTFSGGFFQPGDGTNGQDGTSGSGGGGGGGGGSFGDADLITQGNGTGSGGGGGGEGGAGGIGASGGTGGGGSFGIYINANGANGFIKDCTVLSSAPGTGGFGGFPGGYGGFGGLGGQGGGPCESMGCGGDGGDGGDGGNGGIGGNGAPGISQEIYEDPSGVVANITNMNAPVEPQVSLRTTGCTWSDITFETNATGLINWYFDGGSIPLTAEGQTATIQYSTLGLHTITLLVNGVPYIFTDFANIITDGTPFLPTINSNADSICPGDNASFSSSYNALNYKWDFGGGATPNTLNGPNFQTANATFNSEGTYYVTLQTTSACCGNSKIDTFIVTVVPFKTPEVYISSTKTDLCGQETVTFGAIGVNGGSTPNYTWLLNGNAVGNSNTYTNAALQDGDVIRCQMSSSYQCPQPNPVTSAPITISVHPIPQMTCSVSAAYLGGNTTFNTNITVGTAPFEFFWTFGDGGSSTDSVPQHMYGGTGLYNANVIITDVYGCQTSCSMPVDIILPPIVEADFTFAENPTCQDNTVNFTNTSPQGNPVNFQWDFGDGGGLNPGTSNVSHTYTIPGVYTVRMVADNNVFPDTVVYPNLITVWPRPSANFSANPRVTCDSVSVQFFDESVGATKWNWNFGDGSSGSSLQNPMHSFTQAGTYNITLDVENEYGCTSSQTLFSYIIVNPSPNAGFTTTDTMVCTTVPVFFDGTLSTIQGTITSYDWTFYGAEPLKISGTDSVVSTVYPNPGTYDVQLMVTNNFGCTDTLLISRYIDAIPYPEASFYPDTLILQMPDTTIQMINTSRYYNQWEWSFGNGTSSRERNPVAIYPDSGTFDITLLISNELGCVDTAIITIRVLEQETFFVPTAFTPDGDGLNEFFSPKGRGIADYELTIFDRWGQVLYRTKSLKLGWNGKDRFGNDVPPGIYAYRVDLEWFTGKKYTTLGSISLVK